MVDHYHINLIKKYLKNQCTPAEKLELETWFELYSGGDRAFYDNDSELINQAMMRSLINIQQKIDSSQTPEVANKVLRPQHKFRWVAVAATILLFTVIGIYFYSYKNTAKQQVAQNHVFKNNIQPGCNKAILTLGNGKKIVLDDVKNGQLAVEGNVVITKDVDGHIIYNATNQTSKAMATAAIAYNTITTPKGGQYQVRLPDRSSVWLDAASSISFPSTFTGDKRQVQLAGEAYFEVAKDRAKPFLVNVEDKQQIEVLGTHFNVQAYPDDRDIKTTLLEGSVKLLYKNKQAILKPGQTAVNNTDQSLIIKPADIYEVMAWKNNMFVFNNENIKSIMKRLSRWYDVDVVFEGNVEKVNFFGNYSRSKSLVNLLKDIELTEKVHFKIKGRRVTIIAQ